MTKYSIQPNKAIVSQSLSAEHTEKQPPHNPGLATWEDKLKLGTLCNHILGSMEDMGYNEARKVEKAKTSHVERQNPLPDMQVLPAHRGKVSST